MNNDLFIGYSLIFASMAPYPTATRVSPAAGSSGAEKGKHAGCTKSGTSHDGTYYSLAGIYVRINADGK